MPDTPFPDRQSSLLNSHTMTLKDANIKKKKESLNRSFATSPKRIFPQINSVPIGTVIPPHNQYYPLSIQSSSPSSTPINGTTNNNGFSSFPFVNMNAGNQIANNSSSLMTSSEAISPSSSALQSSLPLSSIPSSRFVELLNALKLEYEHMQRELMHQQFLFQRQQNITTSNPNGSIDSNANSNLLKELAGFQNHVIELENRYQQALASHREEIKSLQMKIYNQIMIGDSSKNIPPILKIDTTSKFSSFSFPSPPSLDHVGNILAGIGKTVINEETGNGNASSNNSNITDSNLSSIKPPQAVMKSFNSSSLNHELSLAHSSSLSNKDEQVEMEMEKQEKSTIDKSNEKLENKNDNSKEIKSFLDWLVIYNDNLKKNISIELMLTISIDSIVSSIKFNPNGSILALGTNNQVCLYSTKNGDLLHKLIDIEESNTTMEFYYRALSFNKAGSILATGSEDKIIRLWDIDKLKLIKRLQGHSKEIYGLVFDNQDNLYSAGGDRIITKWNCQDLNDIKCVQTLKTINNHKMKSKQEGRVKKESEKDKNSGNNGNNNEIEIENSNNSNNQDCNDNDENFQETGFSSIAITSDDNILASGTLDNKIILWNVKSGETIHEIMGHSDSVYSITFSHQDKYLLSGSLDHTIKMWKFDLDTLLISPIQTMTGHKDYVLAISSISKNSKEWIISGGKDSSINVWNMESDQSLSPIPSLELVLKGHANSIISISSTILDNDLVLFASASGDGRARIWVIKPLK